MGFKNFLQNRVFRFRFRFWFPPLILIEKKQNKFVTSVHRKPTFTGQYTRWESFGPKKRNTNLIGIFFHRTLEIFSEEKLASELNTIRRILRKNGYIEDVINLGIKKKISGFRAPKHEGPEKCLVSLKIPWIGNVSLKFEKQTKNVVNKCFGTVFTRVIFLTRKMMPSIRKDRLPSIQRSNVVYKYLCHCDSAYVGRTSQRLEDRITLNSSATKPDKLLPQRSCKTSVSNPNSDSAIGLHLLQNKNCADNYNNNVYDFGYR